jgi:hypothetical protein
MIHGGTVLACLLPPAPAEFGKDFAGNLERKPSMTQSSNSRTCVALDRRAILKACAATSLAGAMLVERSGAQSTPDTSQGHAPTEATPESTGGPEALTTLLRHVPASLVSLDRGSRPVWYYTDLAQQFAALNLHHDANGPAWDDEPWTPAIVPLAFGSAAFQYVRRESFIDSIGFQPLGMDQALMVGNLPHNLTLFRGGLDPDRLYAAWSATGYEHKASAGGESVWTIGENGEFELGQPVHTEMIAAFNNLALLGDVLLCAPTMAMLEEALAVAQSGEGSLGEDATLAATIATVPATTVSAMAAPPLEFANTLPPTTDPEVTEALESSFADSDAAVGPMPASKGVLFGVTAGAVQVDEGLEDAPFEAPDFDAGEGLALVRLAMDTVVDARQAVKVVEYRWNTMNSVLTADPYRELMAIVIASAEGEVATIDFIQTRSPTVWRNVLLMQDLLPFLPSGED